ncbi:hypothetical protein K469DRAFT_306925 [Zopfia rhizophila CBS 207.26]|uniref:Uncharacterized protein n=1 Tax=Zopfia rhizophila CBS 207.26 TaxID=1314779 RepID=A0A6A6EML5_9PEZI|nr:hypothetical protein K469DRAFT_306925 [Zopfia rhizophila CBS 207.26]
MISLRPQGQYLVSGQKEPLSHHNPHTSHHARKICIQNYSIFSLAFLAGATSLSVIAGARSISLIMGDGGGSGSPASAMQALTPSTAPDP